MDLRLALYDIAASNRLDRGGMRRLHQLAGLHDEPANLTRRLMQGVAVLAAALGGLGVVLWVAANWDTWGRLARFALLQGLIAAMCIAAAARPRLRRPLALVALLAIGGLFGYFGQTYQTGADPWQLFALWAALALPLCLGTRSDALWAPWSLVAMTAVALWMHARLGHRWSVDPQQLGVHLAGWCMALGITAALSRPAARWTGAGPWALRTALTLGVAMIVFTALAALFGKEFDRPYLLALAALAIGAVAFATHRFFDVYALSAIGLGLDALLVAWLARTMLDGSRGDAMGRLLVIGLVAAGLLAATVNLVLRLARRHDGAGAAT